MERLTEELNPAYPTPKHFGARYMQKIVSSLADYERTELTPEQIRELKERDTAKELDDSCTCDGKTCYKCPNCGEIMLTEYDDGYRLGKVTNFCENCGQRLKWED